MVNMLVAVRQTHPSLLHKVLEVDGGCLAYLYRRVNRYYLRHGRQLMEPQSTCILLSPNMSSCVRRCCNAQNHLQQCRSKSWLQRCCFDVCFCRFSDILRAASTKVTTQLAFY